MANTDFSGIWLSSYSFHNDARNFDGRSEHYVRIFKNGDDLVVESVPGLNAAYVILRLHVAGNLATGSWQEETAPEGYFKGAIYSGALQLLIADDKKSMKGKWVAFTSSGGVKSNDWELTYIDEKLPEDTAPIQTERPDDKASKN